MGDESYAGDAPLTTVVGEAPERAQDRDYCLERAEHHLGLGEAAFDSRASWAHFQLAGRYLDRAFGSGDSDEGWESEAVRIPVFQ